MSIRRRDTSTKEDDEDSTPKFLSETHRQLQHIPITSSEVSIFIFISIITCDSINQRFF